VEVVEAAGPEPVVHDGGGLVAIQRSFAVIPVDQGVQVVRRINRDRRSALGSGSNRCPPRGGRLLDAVVGAGAGAAEGMYVVPEPAELASRAGFVIEAAGWFPGRARDFAIALGEEPNRAGLLPDWLVNLVLDLGRAGLGAEAAAVGESLARVDPGLRSTLDGDVAVALARAGMAERALAKVAENLTLWPDDVSMRMDAGEALSVLGDREGARAHFRAAVDLAEELDDFEARAESFERLRWLERLDQAERPGAKPEPGQRPTIHRNQRARGARSRRRRGR